MRGVRVPTHSDRGPATSDGAGHVRALSWAAEIGTQCAPHSSPKALPRPLPPHVYLLLYAQMPPLPELQVPAAVRIGSVPITMNKTSQCAVSTQSGMVAAAAA